MANFRLGGFQVLPPVIKNLIIINVVVLVLQWGSEKMGIDLSAYLGLHHWSSALFKPWQIVTYMFLHATDNLMHIFSNMFALWMFGSTLENVLGPKRFLILYFVCGIGAALCHLGILSYEFHTFQQAFMVFQNNPTIDQYTLFLQHHSNMATIPEFRQLLMEWSNDPSNMSYSHDAVRLIHSYQTILTDEGTIGASGAVFGILFTFAYMFPNMPLYLYFLVPIKAKWLIAGYALFELYAGYQNTAGDNIAHFAHLGGMLFAFILLRIWGQQSNQHFY